jgi:hypothetical protein
MPELQVGDRVTVRSTKGIVSIETIERVTKTQAISKRRRFKRTYTDNGFVRIVGQNTWSPNSARITDVEDVARLRSQNMRIVLSHTKWSDVSDDVVADIYSRLVREEEA